MELNLNDLYYYILLEIFKYLSVSEMITYFVTSKLSHEKVSKLFPPIINYERYKNCCINKNYFRLYFNRDDCSKWYSKGVELAYKHNDIELKKTLANMGKFDLDDVLRGVIKGGDLRQICTLLKNICEEEDEFHNNPYEEFAKYLDLDIKEFDKKYPKDDIWLPNYSSIDWKQRFHYIYEIWKQWKHHHNSKYKNAFKFIEGMDYFDHTNDYTYDIMKTNDIEFIIWAHKFGGGDIWDFDYDKNLFGLSCDNDNMDAINHFYADGGSLLYLEEMENKTIFKVKVDLITACKGENIAYLKIISDNEEYFCPRCKVSLKDHTQEYFDKIRGILFENDKIYRYDD